MSSTTFRESETREAGASPNGHEPEEPPITGSVKEEARAALRAGRAPIPIPFGKKHPNYKDWTNLRVTEETFPQFFSNPPMNWSILNGAPSDGLIDADLDHPIARELAPEFLPPTNSIFGRKTSPESHWQYFADPLVATTPFLDPLKNPDAADAMLLELRSTGSHTVQPGSRHQDTAELIAWSKKGEPARVDGNELRWQAAKLAAATALVHNYPKPGGRDEIKNPLIGGLMRLGWPDDEIELFYWAILTAADDEEAEKRIQAIARNRERLEKGETLTGFTTLKNVLDERLVKRLQRWCDPRTWNREPARTRSITDFHAFLPDHNYLHAPDGVHYPAASVNAIVPKVFMGVDESTGKEIFGTPSKYLDQHRPIHQATWVPGLPQIIEGKLLHKGGWIENPELVAYNSYKPPTLELGDPDKAGPWIDHIAFLYPDEADFLIKWFAHRRQRPGEKINHALFLGGAPGIGKDSILTPVRPAVGDWNVAEVSPTVIMGRFTQFLENVILHITEARDLGEVNRYAFAEKMKVFEAAPPDVLLVERKNLDPYPIPNVCGVVYTSNDRIGPLHLSPDDRRHLISWSERTSEDFRDDYFTELHTWYREGGSGHVAAYLATLDLSSFDGKAPPPKTEAFWTVVDAGRPPEDHQIADVLDAMNGPDAVTLKEIIERSNELMGSKFGGFDLNSDLVNFLRDRRNAPQIPRRMEAAGYVRVHSGTKDGVWKIHMERQAIYARKALSAQERFAAAQEHARLLAGAAKAAKKGSGS